MTSIFAWISSYLVFCLFFCLPILFPECICSVVSANTDHCSLNSPHLLLQPLTYDQVKFNTTAECKRPLVRTDNSASWWEGLDGCGVQCQNPLFTESEHEQVHVLVAVLGSLCVVSTLFTVVSGLLASPLVSDRHAHV